MIENISINKLVENDYNPRKYYDDAAILRLSESIKEIGLVQSLTIREINGGKYEIICGMRRFKAVKLTPLESIPCLIVKATDQQAKLLALTENLERQDLNPIEEARAFANYLAWNSSSLNDSKHQKNMKTKIDIFSKKIGMGSITIYKRLNLLELPEEVQIMVENYNREARTGISLGAATEITKLKEISNEKQRSMHMIDLAKTFDGDIDNLKYRIDNILENIKKAENAKERKLEQLKKLYEESVDKLIEVLDNSIEKLIPEDIDEYKSGEYEGNTEIETTLVNSYLELIESEDVDIETIEGKCNFSIYFYNSINEILNNFKDDTQWKELRDNQISIEDKMDRLSIHLQYVKEFPTYVCVYCGAGINVDKMVQKLKEYKEDLTEINKIKNSIDKQKNKISTIARQLNKSIEFYNSKWKFYDDLRKQMEEEINE
ncbi:MAG: ParB/RepB/Spo0J family partition protein [Candidatus Lokiarchaeia archaeon]